MVTQSRWASEASPVGSPGMEIVRTTWRDPGSTRLIVASSRFATQTEPAPSAIDSGRDPTGTWATIRLVRGSIRPTELGSSAASPAAGESRESRYVTPPATAIKIAAPASSNAADGRLREGAGLARRGAASAGSCVRIACSSCRSSGPGSSPSSSSSMRRNDRYASSASACLPER